MKIAIYGYGVVGNAVHRLFEVSSVLIQDPALGFKISQSDLASLGSDDFVAICASANYNGKNYDCRGITEILNELSTLKSKALIAIKSTIAPSNVKTLMKLFPELNIIIWPEFLKEVTADADIFETQQIMGGNVKQLSQFRKVLENSVSSEEFDILRVRPEEAMQIKIIWNLFGAMKVSFWHSIHYSGFANIPTLKPKWERFTKYKKQGDFNTIALDGKPGYGGKCFPKEVNAYLGEYQNPLIEAMRVFNSSIREDEETEGSL